MIKRLRDISTVDPTNCTGAEKAREDRIIGRDEGQLIWARLKPNLPTNKTQKPYR